MRLPGSALPSANPMKTRSIVPLVACFALTASAAGCERASKSKSKSGETVALNDNAPKLELFVMSQCPYGVQVVDAAAEAQKALGPGTFDLDIEYIGSGSGDNLQSMHGPSEVTGNIAQLCAMELAPSRYLDMLVCQNKDMASVDSNWKECAPKADIDADALGKCIEGPRGKELLSESFAKAQERGATGSPTIFLAGNKYQGGRKARDFMRAVCDATEGTKPEACKSIPEPPKVEAIFLSDSRCAECDIRGVEPRLKSVLGGLVVEHVDYSSDRGKALWDELKVSAPHIKGLPVVLLDEGVKKDEEGYAQLQRFIRPAGQHLELAVGGTFDPTAEICDNDGTDDDGDGSADCKDSDCKEDLSCRPAKPATLDLFAMSKCPYGAKALIAADQLADHFGDDLDLNIHFIGNVQGDKLVSMKGQSEVDEDMRQICAADLYPKNHKYMDYLACRSLDYNNPEWKPCAEKAGMDADRIQSCFDGKGKDLLAKSFEYSDKLGMTASPTLLANNTRSFNAIDAATMQREFCQDNPKLAGCNEPIAPGALDAPASAAQPAPQQCN